MNQLVINADRGHETISRHVYGQFSEHLGRCIYDGIWVGPDSPIANTRGIRDDVVAALRAIDVPNLRWPGGCFASEYHWTDGIGPRDQRPGMVNTMWGGVSESNAFGTHEFFDLCEQIGCEPFICGNLGSGSVREMQQWVEYITFDGRSPMADLRRANGRDKPWKVSFWGIGNENWIPGGNMRAEYYSDAYRRQATYLRNLSGNTLQRVACGPEGAMYDWTDTVMRECFGHLEALALHHYCGFGWCAQTATQVDDELWFHMLADAVHTDELLTRHGAIMDRVDPGRTVTLAVDEWGTWYAGEPGMNPMFLYQQNTLLDAVLAGTTLSIFHNHCDRVRMANIAQTVNVLQAMILTDGDRMLLTPTYHVFEMYKVHQDAVMLPVDLRTDTCGPEEYSVPSVSASASRDAHGRMHVSLCNLDPHRSRRITVEVRGQSVSTVTGRILTDRSMNAHNTFQSPGVLKPGPFDGAAPAGSAWAVKLPAKSVVVLEAQ